MGTGGAPFNVLIQLARLEPSLWLEAVGLVGDDDDGRWIIEMTRDLGADVSHLTVSDQTQTSYTDVMTVESTGDRTFFHLLGANSELDVEHIPISKLTGRIFHFGYLLLLSALDRPDEEYGTRAARVLARAQEAGMRTSIDLVSAEGGAYKEKVVPALRHTDYCIINEHEAGGVTGRPTRGAGGNPGEGPDWEQIEHAAREIGALGVGHSVTVHFPEGAVSYDVQSGELSRVESLPLPEGWIKGAAGAGDAFCSGVLYGLHEGWEMKRSMELGHLCAAACMRAATCDGGLATMAELEEIKKELTDAK